MGEEMGKGQDVALEMDTKEALKGMQFDLSSKGAREALIQMGRWTNYKDLVQPWTVQVLDAAKTLETFQAHKRKNLSRQSLNDSNQDEGIVDLSNLPCVAIDAKGTSFRDDAVGLRPRKQTGRKLNHPSNKWELLIHIVDVSDVFTP